MVESVQEKAKKHLSGNKVYAIVAGILLAILGVVFFVFPLGSMLFIDIFVTIGLLIFGIFRIISFIGTPSGYRDGWELAQGIIFAICAIFILASNAASVLVSFAFVLGFLALMVGINQIVSYSALRGVPGAGFALASGIINILLALFLLFAPIASTAVLAYVEGIYLIIAGIALVIEGFSKKPASFFDALD